MVAVAGEERRRRRWRGYRVGHGRDGGVSMFSWLSGGGRGCDWKLGKSRVGSTTSAAACHSVKIMSCL